MTEGKLIIVPGPIGNLKDITLRALEVLKTADLILAEDTRTSGVLLKHYEIKNQLKSYHNFNEHKQVDFLVDQLRSGKQIAMLSDAGTPGISDPGYLLIRACVERQITIEALPGATAFVPALLLSGFPCDRFVFEGFLPHKKGRNKRLTALKEEERTIIFYESPHRLLKLLKEIDEILGSDRQVSISREITKLYEETLRGTPKELMNHFEKGKVKGEFVVVIKGA